jgi:hypothetical protein
MLKNRSIPLLAIAIPWFFLAIFPWQTRLDGWTALRFGVGVLVYLIPGMLAFFHVSDVKNFTFRTVLGGLVVSMFVTGLLGGVARLFHLNFIFIRWMFALWGVGMFLLLYLNDVNITIKFKEPAKWEIFLLVLAAGGIVYFASITRPPLIHDDAFTYNALLYYYQHAPVLDFSFPDALSRLEIPRFWIAYWPLVEAMISEFSGVDGLFVTGIYLPILLAWFSFLGIYTLGRTLGLSRVLAGAAVLAQGFSLMRLTGSNQPGKLFFQRLTEDKVVAAFVISLMLVLLVIEYFDRPGTKRLLLAGIGAFTMAFTHPVQFGMVCMVVGVYGLPYLFSREMRGKYLLLIGVLAFVVAIPYFFRFGGGEYSQTLSFSMEDVAANDEFSRLGNRRVDIIEGTGFYGISRFLTSGLPYEAGIIAAILAILFFWRNKAARYILASFLVLAVSVFPYTGWIIGMFTTPFQLWRLTWLTPFGLAFAFLAWFGFEIVQRFRILDRWGKWLSPLYHFLVFSVLISLIVYIRPWAMGNIGNLNRDVYDIYSNYLSTASLMNELEVNSPIIVGGTDAVTNAIIPSLTMKYEPLVFRVESGGVQTQLWKALIDDDIPADERFSRFREHGVEYLLLKGEPDWIPSFLNEYPTNVSRLFREGRFSLYKISY